MLCDFSKINNKWICKNCGRNQAYQSNQKFMPIAKCRIPEDYYFRSQYIHNKKIKGVGDTLSEIINKIGYAYPNVSGARAKLTYMNKKGIDWCDQNQELIIKWIKEECTLYQIQFLELIAKAIVRLAIRKAKNQMINL